MWRPDIGKYTGHLQRAPKPGMPVTVPDAQCNVIPQANQLIGAMSGPVLRQWQYDYANKESMYYQVGFDTSVSTSEHRQHLHLQNS